MRSERIHQWLLGVPVALALVLTGCLGPLAKRLADRETYPIIAHKQQQVLGESEAFTIEPEDTELTETVLTEAGFSSDEFTTSGLVISLRDALALAFDNNREYQERKEDLYLAALDLTEERYDFSPIFSNLISASATREPGTRMRLIEEVIQTEDPLTGDIVETIETRTQSRSVAERFGQLDSSIGVSKLFATGARVTVNFTNRLLRFYSGDRRQSESSLLGASVVQPLLEGGGMTVTLENMRQAERDVIYAARAFARFQRRFVVEQISNYFRLLQAHDEINNEFQSYTRLRILRERAEAFEREERWATFQVDQALQDEIRARDRWTNAKTEFQLRLDQFKVDLGLPTELNIQPSPEELDDLREQGVVELFYNLAQAEEIALADRLDYKTAVDLVEDSDRRIKIAENSLLPVLDARFDYELPSSADNQPFDFDYGSRRYTGSLDLELPLDRKLQRNDYRRAQIGAQSRERNAEETRDEIVRQVRGAYRNLDQSRISYQIQQEAERLARRRVDSVKMLLEAIGREDVNIRDQLEAERALLSTQNDLTNQLVNYTIARLAFYNAIEQLDVDVEDAWYDIPDN